jgi:hypothetical protein
MVHVLVERAEWPTYWYNSHIGEVFTVISITKDAED